MDALEQLNTARIVKEPRSRSLIAESPGPLALRVALAVILIGNIGMLVASNVQLAATVSVKLNVWLKGVGSRTLPLDTDQHFSLVDTLRELYQSNSYLLWVLILCLSGIWPYLEIFLLLYSYLMPGLSPGGRDAILTYVEMFSKWSFIDIFILAIFIVAFNVNIKVSAPTASAKLDIFIEAKYGFYLFVFATMISMIAGQIMLRFHRAVHGPGVPVDARPAREPDMGKPLALWQHPLRQHPPRFWQKLVPPAAAIIFALLVWSYCVTVLNIEVGGLAGYVQDLTKNGDNSESYTAPDLFGKLPNSSPDDSNRPLVKIFMGICVIFAFAMPVLHVVVVFVLWTAPLKAKWQQRLNALAELALGWASLDVLLVAFLAAATQLSKLVKSFVKGPCREIDGALTAFLDAALKGDTTCFRLTVHVRPGCILLAVAAVVHMVFGAIVAHNSATIVAERVIGAERADRRSSFFLIVDKEGEDDDASKGGISEFLLDASQKAAAATTAAVASCAALFEKEPDAPDEGEAAEDTPLLSSKKGD